MTFIIVFWELRKYIYRNKNKIMKTYTEKEVKDILTSVFVFSGANDNQGLAKINGKNYDEKIQTVLNANNTSRNKSIVEAINNFT